VPIRVRLAAAFTVAMAAVLVALGALVYVRVEGALRHSVDQALRAQAAESLRRVEADDVALDSDARESGAIVQLLDRSGRVVRSDPAGLHSLLDEETLVRAEAGDTLETVQRGAGERNRWRALAVPVDGRVLVVARSLRSTEEALHHVFRGLLVAAPVGLLLAGLGGYLLAASALRPVESMRRRASAISAHTPGLRLPVPTADDEIGRLAVTLNDMLARLEAGLAHERRFLADASHELRTPLALLKAELDLALRRPRGAAELRSAVESAAEETDRLVRLAEDLLLIARSDQSGLPLRRERLRVADVAEATAARFAARSDRAGRRIVVDVPAGTEVEGDRLRLEQALANLVDNGLRHGAGTVTMRARPENGAVVLHVTDEGAGFPAGFAARAFERFSRGDDARAGAGSGLGLAIVAAIARAHGGDAGVAPSDGGADVWLRLPAAASTA